MNEMNFDMWNYSLLGRGRIRLMRLKRLLLFLVGQFEICQMRGQNGGVDFMGGEDWMLEIEELYF